MQLTAENVEAVFTHCLFQEDEDSSRAVLVEGIVTKAGLHPERLEQWKPEIRDMLHQLPDEFQQEIGGGWSFLNACAAKDGTLWTGLHQTMEHLFLLGLATGLVKEVLPRSLWAHLPGGMPYYAVLP